MARDGLAVTPARRRDRVIEFTEAETFVAATGAALRLPASMYRRGQLRRDCVEIVVSIPEGCTSGESPRRHLAGAALDAARAEGAR